MIRNRQIGWSNKCNMLYDILDELKSVTYTLGSSTTSSSTTPSLPCNTYVLINGNVSQSYSYVNCNGDTVTGDLADGQSLIICARSVSFGGNLFNIGGDPCNSTCILYQVTGDIQFGGTYNYINCEGNAVGPQSLLAGEKVYICAQVNTIAGDFISISPLNLCKCISYTLEETSGDGPGVCNYIGCDFIDYKNVSIPTGSSITVCSLTVPIVSLSVNITPNSICNP